MIMFKRLYIKMTKIFCWIIVVLFAFSTHLMGQQRNAAAWDEKEAKKVMSEAYWSFWNDDVQRRIDEDIEQYRKAEAIVALDGAPVGTDVQIEQLSHGFLFGGNIFLFGDLETPEQNRKYEDTFGTLFNAATVPFYWKTLEPEQGKPRFEEDSQHSYRRPPTDRVVAFCETKHINMTGNYIIYGSRQWRSEKRSAGKE